MLGKKFYEKRFSPYPFPKSFLIFIRLYGVLYYHPKLATVSLVSFPRPKGISREPCEHIALLYIAFASGKHIAPSYARHFFPQARDGIA